MRETYKKITIAIPYYPAARSIGEHEKGFICPKCGYTGQIMNANFCPGCGLKISLLFVNRGEWEDLLKSVLVLPEELQEKVIYKPRRNLKALRGISGIILEELRKAQEQVEKGKEIIPGQEAIGV